MGLELHDNLPGLDSVVVPIGGGGLCAGISSAVKQLNPGCKIFGVEPEGADSMSRSLKAGSPQSIEKVDTIADSLGAPHAAPYSFGLCRKFVDEVVLVTDAQLARAMKLMFEELKLGVEPAGASAMAAVLGPLRDRIEGRSTGLIVCGTNINAEGFHEILEKYA